jgi:hypothetical protein
VPSVGICWPGPWQLVQWDWISGATSAAKVGAGLGHDVGTESGQVLDELPLEQAGITHTQKTASAASSTTVIGRRSALGSTGLI